MKKILLFAFSLFLLAPLFAQRGIEISEQIEELHAFETKVFQCSNGNTAVIHFKKNDRIEVNIYNKARKLVAKQQLFDQQWGKLDLSIVEGIYEINKEIVVFLEILHGRHSILFRLRINTDTGLMTFLDKLEDVRFITISGAILVPAVDRVFHVAKDSKSDEYTIAAIYGYDWRSKNRTFLKHYNGNHVLTDTTSIRYPALDEIRFSFVDMIVNGKDTYLSLYAHNDSRRDKEGSVLVLSRFTAGENKTLTTLSNLQLSFYSAKGTMAYNPVSEKVCLLLTARIADETPADVVNYGIFLVLYGADNLAVEDMSPVPTDKLVAHYDIDKKTELDDLILFGFPLDIVIRKDGNMIIPFGCNGMHLGAKTRMLIGTTYDKKLGRGDIGLLTFSPYGKILLDEVIKTENRSFGYHQINAVAKMKRSSAVLERTTLPPGFYRPDIIPTDKGLSILVNEGEGTNIAASNTICYKLGSEGITKFHFYMEPERPRHFCYSYVGCGSYAPESHTYASLIIDNNKSRKAYIAWVKLE